MIKNDTWVKPYLKKYKPLLRMIFILGTLTVFCGGALMFTSGYTIDKSATRPYNILLIYVPVLLTRAFGIGRPVFRYLERLRSHNWVLKVTSDLRTRLYKTLEKDASYFNEEHKSGEILGLLAEDINHIQNLFLRTVFPAIIGYIVVILVSLGIGFFNIWFGLLILLLLVVETVLVPLVSVAVESARKAHQKQIKAQLYTELTDNILGANDWIIANRQADFKNLTNDNIHQLNVSKIQSMSFTQSRDFLLNVVFGIMIVTLLIFTNLYFTGNQEQANWVAAFALGLLPLSDSLIPVSQGFEEWPEYKDSIQRLNGIQTVDQQLPAQTTIDLDKTDIKIDNVSFNYSSESKELITDFSQVIPNGNKLAIIGPSGSGKTTILQLLMGDLQAIKGKITINDVDVLQLQDQRTELFSVLNQDPFLFNTSVMNNIRLGNEHATEEQVKEAIQRVGMKETIEKLPQKYDTLVEESGQRFSGGEKQRLSLARILLQDTPIVLLDEPTVGLDPITENKLLETLFDVLSDKTIIWVTHHLHSINHADKVIFLSDSQIEMQGNPVELYKTNKHFQELYKMDQGK
ncbi:amino acid ABC transporter ATP-binding protein [Companilactobacillus sp. RD055328]|uniref:thiol reductant ABC exporter subunit CydC n=1 Tax=Companilactobacillus sp. RD055328 TaxID=2916634 RepID=UPI001FC818FA|nr:thiol reductant ABC exporter subunit CydC [Companilactobacillus sp. RD055328]GKQ43422.1 amino acid ABC transporter ATP-binding protein [Companilactobacillus sp. RD055328]